MLKPLFYSHSGFKLVHYLEYFTILFIATEAELDFGLALGSSWILEGDQIYSYESCAWLSPPSCLTAKPSSLPRVLLGMLYGISQLLPRNRAGFLHCLGHSLCLHHLSSCWHKMAAKLFPAQPCYLVAQGVTGSPVARPSFAVWSVGRWEKPKHSHPGLRGLLTSHQHPIYWVLGVMPKEQAWGVMPFREFPRVWSRRLDCVVLR